MIDGTFKPTGPTYLVGLNPVHALPALGEQISSYRIMNITAAMARISWYPGIGKNTPNFAAVAPASNSTFQSVNTISMNGGGVETFRLPQNCWFVSDTNAAFEVTPGEGM